MSTHAPETEGESVLSDEHAPQIAVVNDDSDFLRLMTELLEGEGYRVGLHTNGAAAFPSLRHEPPALVVLDIRLERPDAGWQLLEMLRLDPALRGLPVIVCSADGPFLRANAERLQEKGVAILPKPFDLDELLGLIQAGLKERDATPTND